MPAAPPAHAPPPEVREAASSGIPIGARHAFYEPDALVNCGPPIPDDATAAPNPVVIVEVLSPSTASLDAEGKLADYLRLPPVQHYLLVRPLRRQTGDRIETVIVRQGLISLNPPGIEILLDAIYAP